MDWSYTLIGSLVGSITLSIIGNLLTDPVKSWITKRSLISKHRRIVDLKKDLDIITKLFTDNRKLQYETTYAVTVSGISMVFGIASGIGGTASLAAAGSHPAFSAMGLATLFALLGEIGGGIFLILGISSALRHLNLMRKLMRYNEYRQELETRISELSDTA